MMNEKLSSLILHFPSIQSSSNLKKQTNKIQQPKIKWFRLIKRNKIFKAMKNQKYIPVDCGFYDNLEAFATTRKTVAINYLDTEYKKTIQQNIKVRDLETKNGEEFMIFEVVENTEAKNVKIRLDRLIDIDGIEVPRDSDSCSI